MPARHDKWDMVAESQRKANDRYQKSHIRQYNLRLNVRTDTDIIRFLDGTNNRQGLLKRLLREEIERKSREHEKDNNS